MRIRTLGRTGLRVSEICLGAMTFGMPEWGCDERESLALIDRFLEAGGNFIDTADAYSGTISEEICGQALAGRRTQIVLATKVTMPVGSGPNDRGASRKHIRESCDASLRRLKTDYIDLYQIHAEDLWTPLEETLGALDDLVRAGKVLYTGASNFRAYRLMKALALADRHGHHRGAQPGAARRQPGRDRGHGAARDHGPAGDGEPHRARVPRRLHRLHPRLAREPLRPATRGSRPPGCSCTSRSGSRASPVRWA